MKSKNQHPKYWGSLEELDKTPAFVESQGKEWVSPPVEHDLKGIQRRDFLKIMGASMLFATTACYRRPVEKIIPYVNRPEEITPGISTWYASQCGECSAGCGILIKTREGRPLKLEGNPAHPMSEGGLCARGQASILNLYDPDRLKGVVTISRSSGYKKDGAWKEADAKIQEVLTQTKAKGGKVRILTGAINSPSTRQLIGDFLAQYPEGKHVSFEGVSPEEIALAQELSYGQGLTPRYRFDQAKMVVSFGADFLGTYLSPVEFSKKFSKSKKVESGTVSRFVCFESALSLTGTNADEYFPLKAGDELKVALALAHQLVVVDHLSSDSEIASVLNPYSIDSVAEELGVPSDKLRAVARGLIENKRQGLVLGGAVRGKNSVALQVVVNLLNSILENDGATVDYEISPSLQAQSSYADLLSLIDEMNQGKVDVLLIYKTNPVFQLPNSLGFASALKKVSFIVGISDRVDETARLCDLVCPDSHYLEAWNDVSSQKGLYGISQPAINPLYETRAFQDSLITWGALPAKSWHEYLKAQWGDKVQKAVGDTQPFEVFWEQALKKGFVDVNAGKREAASASRSFKSVALKQIEGLADKSEGLSLALYPSIALYDGRSANNPWLLELPDPVSKVTWENYLSISPELADELNIPLTNEGEILRVEAGEKVLELPVHIQPKLHAKSVMVAMGYGRSEVGVVGYHIGVDVAGLQKADSNRIEWSGIPVKLTKTGKKTTLAITQGHHTINDGSHDRPIIKESTLAAYLHPEESHSEGHGEGHGKGGHPEEEPTLWPAHKYEGYRWGMAIDLTSCTGCSACVIACQSENNIPVVGKEQVIHGREMHWIRIDRYYSEERGNPKVVHQPMLCQHCENAPCETVCPTLATVHDDEGLNMMVYNRCVGTRYCSNNCPYKVRRFNFFDYYQNEQYKKFNNVEPMNLAMNPDISVRSRGIMEKCTFCMQRIAEGKDHAKDESRRVIDGEVKTACQQSCPSDAIVFGDVNDPKSHISEIRKLKRGFYVLEDLNVKPQVTYLGKVRNLPEKA